MTPLHRKCLLGERLTGEVFLDCHAHIGRARRLRHPGWRAGSPGGRDAPFEHPRRVPLPVRRGADRRGGLRQQPGRGRLLARARRFLGLAMVNPLFERDVLPELERCRDLGFVGIKLINRYQG